MARIEKLIMVTGEENHNKVYELIDNENGTCTAKWGRVGAALQECNYPISEFEKKLKEKVKKGYRVITDLLSVEKSDGKTTTTDDEEVKIQNMSREAMELINFLQSCAKASSSRTTPSKLPTLLRSRSTLLRPSWTDWLLCPTRTGLVKRPTRSFWIFTTPSPGR